MKIGKNIIWYLMALIFWDCSNKHFDYTEQNYSSKIIGLNNTFGLEVGFVNNKFLLLKNYKTLLEIHVADTLFLAKQLRKIKTSDYGVEIHGQSIDRMIQMNDKVILQRSYPSEFQIFSADNPNSLIKFPVTHSDKEKMTSSFFWGSNKILFLTTNIESSNSLNLYIYDLENKSNKLLSEHKLAKNWAEFSLVRGDSDGIQILNPYQQEVIFLNHEGQILYKNKYSYPEGFLFKFMEKKWYANIEAFLKETSIENSYQNTSFVFDFFVSDNSIFMIVVSSVLENGNQIQKRNLIHATLNSKESEIINSTKLPLQFDKDFNLIMSFQDKEDYFFEIMPIDKLILEDPSRK
jgi:hypothetical protein